MDCSQTALPPLPANISAPTVAAVIPSASKSNTAVSPTSALTSPPKVAVSAHESPLLVLPVNRLAGHLWGIASRLIRRHRPRLRRFGRVNRPPSAGRRHNPPPPHCIGVLPGFRTFYSAPSRPPPPPSSRPL